MLDNVVQFLASPALSHYSLHHSTIVPSHLHIDIYNVCAVSMSFAAAVEAADELMLWWPAAAVI